jgi:hypothetical protein
MGEMDVEDDLRARCSVLRGSPSLTQLKGKTASSSTTGFILLHQACNSKSQQPWQAQINQLIQVASVLRSWRLLPPRVLQLPPRVVLQCSGQHLQSDHARRRQPVQLH